MTIVQRRARLRAGGVVLSLVLLGGTACTGSPGTGASPGSSSTTTASTTAAPTTTASTAPTPTLPAEPPANRVLRGDESFPDGFIVPAGEIWEFAPAGTTTVTTRANVVVQGVLRMKPASADVVHTLRFEGVDESAFVGGGMAVLPTDVGLWVIGDGQLDIAGTPRAGWNRTGTDPTWRTGDDIRVAPTAAGDTATFAPFQPGSPVPTVSHAGTTYAAEVLNLTRNVRIEGTGDGEAYLGNGRAHVWISSTRPQSIRHAELVNLGPRKVGEEQPTEGVLGRYPLHFHMMGDASRGTLVEGVVVRNSGNRAFVPHHSHGITFRDTIAFNVFDSAYWWDPDEDDHTEPAPNATNDLAYEHAMAAYVRFDPSFRGYTLSGFVLGEGENLSITDSVAVGIQGNENSSGFHWPATAASSNGNLRNLWKFQGNVAHNGNADGIFVWQNDGNTHLIEGFVAYRNGKFGVEHGAYVNNYSYDGMVLFGNGEAGILSKAAGAERGQRWSDIDSEGIVLGERSLSSDNPIVFDGLTLRGKVVVDEGEERARYEFRNSRTADGRELSPQDFDVRTKVSTIVVYRTDGTSFTL